jgi:hypothetical protein
MTETAKQEPLFSFNDPATYRKMAEPYPSMDEAQAAVEAFFNGVAELRKQHKITTMCMVIKGSALKQDGDGEAEFFLTCGLGNSLEFEGMLAYGLGREQSSRQQRIGSMLKGEGVLHHK